MDKRLPADKPELVVYTTSAFRCPYCVQIKQVLTDNGYYYEERDIADPAIRAELQQKRPAVRTVPQIFLHDDSYVGDCTETVLMIENGKLDLLIDMSMPVSTPMASEQEALKTINRISLSLVDIVQEIEESDGIPPEVMLVCLIRATAAYADKLSIPLDRLQKAIETAREGEDNTCTT